MVLNFDGDKTELHIVATDSSINSFNTIKSLTNGLKFFGRDLELHSLDPPHEPFSELCE